MTSNIIVFYDNQVLLEFAETKEFETWRRACCVGNQEFYNGGYVYQNWISNDQKWYRMDLTPVLLGDVPSALRAWVLVLT